MKTGPRYHVKPRRHRQGITDYRRRLKLLKSGKTRIVVRRSLRYFQVQFITYNPSGDTVQAAALSKELTQRYGWSHSCATTPAAYLTGFLAGKRAQQQGITEGILDIGRFKPTKGNTFFAALKGVLDAGISCPHDPSVLPSEDRLIGTHLNAEIKSSVETVKQKINEGGGE